MSEQYRPIDEQYDTMMDVQDNPTGAWMAIQSLHATVIEQQAEIERLREIISIMDSVTPKADDTCDERGIVLSVAVQRRYPHLSKGSTQ